MSAQQNYSSLNEYPITQKWPATNPDVIQLYSYPTPNGVKISIALEELGLEYEPHLIGLSGDVRTPEFLSLNPNNKIPAIIDPNGPDGKPLALFESGAILLYLAEKAGQLLGSSAAERAAIIQWVFFQVGGLGPMTGQLGFFHAYGGKEIEDPRPRERYYSEVKRLLNVVDQQVANQEWITGEFSIADIAIGPWLRAITHSYKAADEVEFASFKNVVAYVERFVQRPAVEKGLNIPAT
ncbi:glutathione S-transferase N-terminal domain-containing protein [Bacterioplanoides sp. SCSIO 12839]|uniref:glutathione S-transferase N-terminal domain-containing protein n=1 Tax=Bacterioplanoides sp. SCSIO 12839 TaxID=2829569 RepID=UPI00210364ED|nr:glutathione S-transferase N-terminal domain-containing protein [Bacterioplanoides sp. SCSIO 12839]UTW46760.1 glutathione S-transferase N-terminal domain-containing protein [Bacterioplanoides sp. SCSIO 12839]